MARDHRGRRGRRGGAARPRAPARRRSAADARGAVRRVAIASPHGPRAPGDAVALRDRPAEGRLACNASVLVASLLSTRPARCICGCSPARRRRCRSSRSSPTASPMLAFTWVPTPRRRDARSPAAAADLLPDVDRVVVLPLPAVATGDVAELADLDLGAARARRARRARHGRRQRLRRDPRRRGCASSDRTRAAPRAAPHRARAPRVRLRRVHRRRARARPRAPAPRAVHGQALALVEEFGLDDVEALHYLSGPTARSARALGGRPDAHAAARRRGSSTGPTRVKPWQRRSRPSATHGGATPPRSGSSPSPLSLGSRGCRTTGGSPMVAAAADWDSAG